MFRIVILLALVLTLHDQVTPQTQTRSHPRITQTETIGHRLDLKSLKGARLFTGPGFNANKPVALLIHFHDAPWLIETHIARYLPKAALITVQLGVGSSAYRRPFENPGFFQELLNDAAQTLSLKRGWSSVTLSGFSAGYGGVREILRRPENFALVNNVLLLDGMHASYSPEGKLLADRGTIQASDVEAFVSFARAAVARRKTFVIAHSEIFPGAYASTTECADYLLAQLRTNTAEARPSGRAPTRLMRHPKPAPGPMGMQQLSIADAGRFHVRGYAGNTAPDHVDFIHAMPAWFSLLRIK